MPPKKAAAGGPSKKTVEKTKAKIVEDKTFGLKNKNKSTKVQKFIQNVKVQVTQSVNAKMGKKPTDETKPKKSKAELEKEKQEELNSFFQVTQAKVAAGVDPKSVVCEFFKLGICTKGDKCRYAHDLAASRKTEKIDIYADRRDVGPDGKVIITETMNPEQYAQFCKERVAKGLYDIVCKHFLDALEKKQYGFFWICPNDGDKCSYRHALPPGYVLKIEKSAEEIAEDKRREEEERQPIEEQIEEQRKQIMTRTPVTLELFLDWRKRREERMAKEAADKKKSESTSTKKAAGMNGREMFTYNPSLFVDDEDAFVEDDYEKEEEGLDGPERILEATGTSLSVKVKGEGEEGEEETGAVDESLFSGEVDESLFTGDVDGEEGEEGEDEEEGEKAGSLDDVDDE